MIKLISSRQMHEADAVTVERQGILPIELMERASLAFVNHFIIKYADTNATICIFCGAGNNGGDGLTIARLLAERGYNKLRVYITKFGKKATDEFQLAYSRLSGLSVKEVRNLSDFSIPPCDIIIDAVLGSGLDRPVDGKFAQLVQLINKHSGVKVAVDVPTGFVSEGLMAKEALCVKADLVISFEQPKINYLLPDSTAFIKEWVVVPIGLDRDYLVAADTPYAMIEMADVKRILKKRLPFSHKGSYGRSLIIAGAPETMGAALLATKACVYAGSGLTTACIPESGLQSLNIFVPEAMGINRSSVVPYGVNWSKLTAVAIGPGIGIYAKELLVSLLNQYASPIVFDADAINILAANKELFGLIPAGSVLTPHVKEFDKLFGDHDSWRERLQSGQQYAKQLKIYILLKNRYTIIFSPEGEVFFNPTGSPAMSSGGMGDVLTGIITAFIAQGYSPGEAAILGAYIHGRSGESIDDYVIPATRIIERLPSIIRHCEA